ncbi:Protein STRICTOSIDINE SYNTHASE-LIKE 2 like [Actinidia chinensis var. chinensis]|uniref:Protein STRICTOSIDINE SYNTHASE-LIKE 2 like n=1 Tax=Actinidia chinensis var. chinensis TaxID=1590841 RepID=A0A2R6Q4E7_ACTCC|nr:Protein STRICTOSIDINE SYNTHASE-LIKE 2 like [Actinidia chinensis var. chinensis]
MSSKLFLTTFSILLVSASLSLDYINILSHLFNTKKYLSNENHVTIPIEGAVGPESFAFDPHHGGPYTGVSDGRIIKWLENERRWIDFAVTSQHRDGCEGSHEHEQREHICGRPLGLRFDQTTGALYIADAYMGLLVVGPEGGLATKVADQAQGTPFAFTNGLDIDQRNGIVYFSDSSSRYRRRDYISVIVSGDNTGRLMKYDPQSKETTVLLSNLTFPNGVSLSKDGDFILVSETTNCRILRLWLHHSSNAGKVEIFTELPGFPDNIRRNPKGEFWVGIHGRRGRFLKWVISHHWIGNALTKLPFDMTRLYSYFARWGGIGLAMRLSEDGEVLEVLEDKSINGWKCVSEVEERDRDLWIGSIRMPFVAYKKRSSNRN